MAPDSHSIFVEEDDSDASANSNTTEESSPEVEYSVESILAERRDEDGIKMWLVKWEGYPLHRCTWEPYESFMDGNESLKLWAHRKRKIKNGEIEPFDVQKFDDAVDRAADLRNQRIVKREEKRRKKAAVAVSSRRLVTRRERNTILKKGTARKLDRVDDSSSDSSDSPLIKSTLRRTSTPRRKRTDYSVTPTRSAKRKRAIVESPPSSDVNDVVSSQVSLFNDVEIAQPHQPAQEKEPEPRTSIPSTKTTKAPAKVLPKSSAAQKGVEASISRPINKIAVTSPEKPRKVSQNTSLARELGVSASNVTGPTKRSINTVTHNDPAVSSSSTTTPEISQKPPSQLANKARKTVATTTKALLPPKKRNSTQRVNEYTPKDSADPQFGKLSTQWRYQRYAKNEPAPDPNALTFIDPTTGKSIGSDAATGAERTKSVPPQRPESSTMRNADLRRSSEILPDATLSSNPRLDTSSVTGISSRKTSLPEVAIRLSRIERRAPLEGQEAEFRKAIPDDSRHAYPSAVAPTHRSGTKIYTCRFWYKNNNECRHGNTCKYAHYYTGFFPPKRNVTCFFWENGKCNFTDEDCEYVHAYIEDSSNARNEGHLMRRSESPDNSGLRQDEAERRGRPKNLVGRTANKTSSLPRSSAPSLTFVQQREQEAVEQEAEQDDLVLSDAPELPVQTKAISTISLFSKLKLFEAEAHLNLHFGEIVSSVDIRLQFDEKASRAKFLDRIGHAPVLACREMCTSPNFQEYWYRKDKVWTSGNILHGDMEQNLAQKTAIEALEDYLVLNSAGAVVRNEEYVMVVYPTSGSDWTFLPNLDASKSTLRFYVQTAIPHATLPIVSEKKTRKDGNLFLQMCETHLDLKFDVVFGGNNGKLHEQAVFTFFPLTASAELKIIEKFLEETNSRLYPHTKYDLWTQFCSDGKATSRVILFHPSMREYWKIPNFSYVLTGRSDNIFQIGIDKSVCTKPEAATKYTCVRLFPNGSLTFITDDVFKYNPGQAYAVLNAFYDITKPKPQGGRYDRIVTRPGLLAWLAQLIDEDHEAGKLTEDSDRIKVWQIACTLMNLQAAETSNDIPFSNPPVLFSPRKIDMLEYVGLWDSDDGMATDYLVEWFCGLCVDERENFRRFTVLYEQHQMPTATPGIGELKDPKDWMKKAQHVKVTTPKRYLLYLEQKRK